MDFEDLQESAEEELKRVDHLFYVTLKYTRTADVIKNAIKRMISAIDFAVMEALEILEVGDTPDVPRVRIKKLEEILPMIKKDAKFYILLKNIDAAPFKGREEYRKHVTLLTNVTDVDVVKLKNYYDRTTLFVKEIKSLALEKKSKKRKK